MMKPVRIQLSRKAGFRLQDVSMALNGLPAVNVARPGRLGNPYKIGSYDRRTGGTLDAASAVERYLDALVLGRLACSEAEVVAACRGKNVACWCALDAPCHGDVQLELARANPPPAGEGR